MLIPKQNGGNSHRFLSFSTTTLTSQKHAGEMTKQQLYGDAGSSPQKGAGRQSIITPSHATDIRHGMIESYVVVDHQLMFCTVRAGRVLFWTDQNDVGHVPPLSMWDISGMAVLSVDEKDLRQSTATTEGGSC